MISIRTSSGLKSVQAISVRDSAGVLRTVRDAYVRTSAGLKHIFTTFAVTLSKTEVSGYCYSRAGVGGRATSGSVTAQATGANTPFIYAWAKTSGSTGIAANAATSATTTFSAILAAGADATATFACTVTDASGAILTTADVTVDLSNASI